MNDFQYIKSLPNVNPEYSLTKWLDHDKRSTISLLHKANGFQYSDFLSSASKKHHLGKIRVVLLGYGLAF
jgi:hypothetical protein